MAFFILCANCGASVNASKNPKTKRFCSNACSHQGRNPPKEIRFWSKVEKRGEGDCWEWFGLTGRGGYGRFSADRKAFQAHRFSWELHFGAIPEGQLVCHRCDNPRCVNPSHLFLGSSLDNNRDRAEKGRNRDQRGRANNSARLSEGDVRKIREMRAGGALQKDIADAFRVHRITVVDILVGRTWRHVT